jgi:hypothetical protein
MNGVEEADDLAVHVQRARHEERWTHQRCRGLGDGGLAVSRRPVQEDRLAGAERGTEMVEQALGEHKLAEGVVEAFAGDHALDCGLPLRHRRVLRDRHRGRAGVLVQLHQLARLLPPRGGDLVLHPGVEALAVGQ